MTGGRRGESIQSKPAQFHAAGGMIRFGNDIGLSMSDNPLSKFFEKYLDVQLTTACPSADEAG